MKPKHIRCGLTADGHVEAAVDISSRLVIDRRTGKVLESTVREGTDMFRWLVTEARKHKD